MYKPNLASIPQSDVASQFPDDISSIVGSRAEFYAPDYQGVTGSKVGDLYTYKVYIGIHTIELERGDSVYLLEDDTAYVQNGPATIRSLTLATVIRGYAAPRRGAFVGSATFLPYINGCSTRQVFAPERVGDPTLQLLHMPPHTSEQAHHIHSTARVVYVLQGEGTCLIGMGENPEEHKLVAGMTLLLHPMCPHHFVTEDSSLIVLPLHVFSSPPSGVEFNHPMFNGTNRVG